MTAIGMQTRKRQIDFRKLVEVVAIPKEEKRGNPEVYDQLSRVNVERLITRKTINSEPHYLVKWEDYSMFDCSWEPEHHLPAAIIDGYFNPTVTPSQIEAASDKFLCGIKARLSQRCGHFYYVDLNFTLYRYLFGQDDTKLFHRHDFDRFQFPEDWDKHFYSEHGDGRAIEFPMKVLPVLKWSKKGLIKTESGSYQQAKRCPMEYWKIELCTKRLT